MTTFIDVVEENDIRLKIQREFPELPNTEVEVLVLVTKFRNSLTEQQRKYLADLVERGSYVEETLGVWEG